MSARIDLTNMRFGKLLVMEPIPREVKTDKNNTIYWRCICDCGNECLVNGASLRREHTTSCGCSLGKHLKKHGLRYNRLYNIWDGMIGRCYRKSQKGYKTYGARGITVCDEWKNNFLNFYSWAINNGYKETLTIDRIDVNGDYGPLNCRWVTMDEQHINKTNTKLITYDGVTKPLSCLAKEFNIPLNNLYARLNIGWSIEKALTTPVKKRNSK